MSMSLPRAGYVLRAWTRHSCWSREPERTRRVTRVKRIGLIVGSRRAPAPGRRRRMVRRARDRGRRDRHGDHDQHRDDDGRCARARLAGSSSAKTRTRCWRRRRPGTTRPSGRSSPTRGSSTRSAAPCPAGRSPTGRSSSGRPTRSHSRPSRRSLRMPYTLSRGLYFWPFAYDVASIDDLTAHERELLRAARAARERLRRGHGIPRLARGDPAGRSLGLLRRRRLSATPRHRRDEFRGGGGSTG